MAIAGIEGLAQGFMQGMALKRQNDRQDVLDAQNLERFGMDKERFATQQAASAFELQNAQTNAANAAMDRTRALGIQKKGDDFEANLGRILGAGTPEGELVELEKVHQGSGVKGAWARDAKTGGLAKNADGTFKWVNEDGTAYDAKPEDAIGRYIAEVDPKGEFTRKRTQQDELAKEDREAKRTIAAEERAAKTAAATAATLHSYRMSEKAQELLAAKLAKADATLDSKDLATFFSVPITVTDADGKIKISQQVNQENFTNYLQWTKKNKVGMTTNSFRDWRAQMPSSGTTDTTASGTDTYDSTSQGKLVPKGLSTDAAAVQLDKLPLNLSNQGAAQPASPVSGLTVRPTAQAQEKTEVATPAKPVSKTQLVQTHVGTKRGLQQIVPKNNPYQEIQGKFGDPIPNGFKRKKANWDTDVRSPEYNVFVSNNYQD
jgi:hypothetical protein